MVSWVLIKIHMVRYVVLFAGVDRVIPKGLDASGCTYSPGCGFSGSASMSIATKVMGIIVNIF